jgi:hypothetical protein
MKYLLIGGVLVLAVYYFYFHVTPSMFASSALKDLGVGGKL